MLEQLDAALNAAIPGVVSGDMFVVSFVSAFVLGSLMAWIYKATSGDEYNPDIARSQVLLACIMAVVLMIVGDSLSRAFGAVGILSVIRFRSNVGTAAEAATLLGSVAVGMACGAGLFGVAIIGTLFLCVVQLLLRRVFGAPAPKKGQKQGKKEKKKDKKAREAEAVVPQAEVPQPEGI